MNLLQYTSKEMFSSTELIRKSKTVFDKISRNEIEKAVILRDGKPSFMMMDFEKYETLISKYFELENELKTLKEKNRTYKPKDSTNTNEVISNSESSKNSSEIEHINNKDLEAALQKIEQLDLKAPANIEEQKTPKEEDSNTQKQPLNDFWE